MKNIFKLSLNFALLLILLSIVVLPTGFMGIMSYEESPVVLSATDDKSNDDLNISYIKSMDDPEADVPEDIKEMILKMEREYYQKNTEGFVKDINRMEEQEKIEVPETENNLDKE